MIDLQMTPCFSLNKLDVHKRYKKKADSFYIGVVSKGNGRIDSESQHVDVRAGDKFFVPKKTGELQYNTDGGLQLYLVFPPK